MLAEIERCVKAHWRAKGAGGDRVGTIVWGSLRASTQAAYARGLLKWLLFCAEKGLDPYRDVHNVHIMRFVTHLESGHGVGSIRGTLSAVTTCFTMFDLVFAAGDVVRLAIRGVGNSKDTPPDRLPICPHDWVPRQLDVDDLDFCELRALSMLTITQFFGWRAGTVTTLKLQDIRVVNTSLEVQSSHFKTLNNGGLPCGQLSFSKLPMLFMVLHRYLHLADRCNYTHAFGVQRSSASAMMADAVTLVAQRFQFDAPTMQPHGFKRGTVSILKKLGMALEDLNLFVGWSIHSTSFQTYRRFVHVEDIDRKFFHDVVPTG